MGHRVVVCAMSVPRSTSHWATSPQVNLACTIGHDAVLSEDVTLAPGVNISGNVFVGEGCDLGTGAKVIQGRTLGEWSVIGAGAVVSADLPANCTAVGVPARSMSSAMQDGSPEDPSDSATHRSVAAAHVGRTSGNCSWRPSTRTGSPRSARTSMPSKREFAEQVGMRRKPSRSSSGTAGAAPGADPAGRRAAATRCSPRRSPSPPPRTPSPTSARSRSSSTASRTTWNMDPGAAGRGDRRPAARAASARRR